LVAISLRRLALEDMDHAARILRTSFDDRYPWLIGLHTPEEDRDYFREQVFSSCEIWGAVDEHMVGIIAFRQGWIDQLYVLPRYQGQGVGSALLKLAKAAPDNLQLWTFQKNASAREFYEARGFEAIKKTDGSENEEREPDILYRWEKSLGDCVDAGR
jgi:GNAT superfamily N-acetyltransferase